MSNAFFSLLIWKAEIFFYTRRCVYEPRWRSYKRKSKSYERATSLSDENRKPLIYEQLAVLHYNPGKIPLSKFNKYTMPSAERPAINPPIDHA